ncbi:MAG: diaminopimelate epimerase [Christensenellales bacterium]
MKLRFTKMQGCGNDYIYFDTFDQTVKNPSELAVKLSDRRLGIGGDGVILIGPSNVADGRMTMFNADGSEGSMCGNGVRCVGKYLHDSGRAKRNVITVETKSGIKTLELTVENGFATAAKVDMGPPKLHPDDIPCTLSGDSVINREVELAGGLRRITCVSMGNPHCVLFLPEIMDLDLEKIGPSYERSPLFPERVNTEFVKVIDPTHLEMRVWERGSGETLACGTGACAVAVAAVLNGISPKNEDIFVRLLGGTLIIRYTEDTVYMTGPADKVFEGEIEV